MQKGPAKRRAFYFGKRMRQPSNSGRLLIAKNCVGRCRESSQEPGWEPFSEPYFDALTSVYIVIRLDFAPCLASHPPFIFQQNRDYCDKSPMTAVVLRAIKRVVY
jgi:hypothetical protein